MTYRVFIRFLFLTLSVSVSTKVVYAQTVTLRKKSSHEAKCSDVSKPTKYLVRKGDHIAAILRTLQLEPVFGKNHSLEQLLKINHLPNPNLIEPGQELAVPFQCEELVTIWQTQDRGIDRLLTRKKANFVTTDNVEIKPGAQIEILESAAVNPPAEVKIDPQDTVAHIIDDNTPIDEPTRKNIEPLTDAVPPVSEALSYRMICDGEWTGEECVTRYSILFVTLSGWYNRYDGIDPSVQTNNKGLLLSKLDPQAGIGWYNYWTENFKTELYATYQQSQLLPEAREIPIDQNKKYLGSFQVAARYESGPWGIGLGYRQYDKLFYRFRFSGLSQPCFSNDSSFAGCGIFVHAVSIPSYSADLSYMIYQAGKFRFDTKLAFMHLGGGHASSFSVEEGQGHSLDFKITHDRVKEYIFGDISYSEIEQNTSIEKQKASELGFTFGYAWKLKDW